MTENIVEYSYCIGLRSDEALIIKEDLESQIWKIARENQVEEELRNVNFKTRHSEPAPEPDSVITFVVYWHDKMGLIRTLRITDPIMGEVVCTTVKQLLDRLFIPKLKHLYGDDVLKEEDADNSSNH